MARSANESSPIWHERRLTLPLLPMAEDVVTDVCVVGAGITGLTAAYLLAKEGRNVVVLDAYGIAAGETARTTAHLTGVLDERYYDLSFTFGEHNARIIAESHLAAINRIATIVRDENIECGFAHCDGYLVAGLPELAPDIDREAAACLSAGFEDRVLLSSVPLEGVTLAGPALRFPQQAMLNPRKYAAGLAEAIIARGGRIFCGARVTEVHDGTPVETVTESGYRVHSTSAIIATHTPINDTFAMHTKQAAYRSYAMSFALEKGACPPFLLWDVEKPYHYARTLHAAESDYLIVGGGDHKTGQQNDAEDRYAALEAWTRRHFLMAGAAGPRWSGQILEPVDHLAFIGRNPGNRHIYIATGFSGNGMTYGAIAGLLIRDLIDGRDNHWAEIYDPARKSLAAKKEYVRENANALACMVGDWVSRGEVADIADIPPGEGAILRDGLSKVAAFRDEAGEVHTCSAVCTHLNCIVQWNSGEKTWDCPCHGSRFDTDGKVLNGPATEALATRGREDGGLQAPVTDVPLGGPFPVGPIITGSSSR